jgi:hypothetical protein
VELYDMKEYSFFERIIRSIVLGTRPYLQAIKNDRYLWGTIIVIVAGAILTLKPLLVLLAFVSFVQNMAFTASSRSRNSANPPYHYRIACISNAVWFITNYFLILDNVMSASVYVKIITGAVYTVSTAYGSMLMMEIMLKKETGKNKVGANK